MKSILSTMFYTLNFADKTGIEKKNSFTICNLVEMNFPLLAGQAMTIQPAELVRYNENFVMAISCSIYFFITEKKPKNVTCGTE